MNFLACLLLFVCVPEDQQAAITLKDGTRIEGTLIVPEKLKLETGFGEASIRASQLWRAFFGKTDQVHTRDFTLLRGALNRDEIQFRPSDLRPVIKLDSQDVVAVHCARYPDLKAGEFVAGAAANGLTFDIRAPSKWDGKSKLPVIIILHGSNMNAKSYGDTIVSRWPNLANKYMLVAVNGENWNVGTGGDFPTFNYSYVNFVGKSTFKGYPGTDRESPALLAELITAIKKRYPVERIFVGGHSQGAFLTYSVLMNYPDLIDGAFPASGGLIFQCEPTAYANEALRTQQRKVPIAILHCPTDNVVNFESSRYASQVFLEDGFTRLKFFSERQRGHMFAFLHIEQAINWLDAMSSSDPAALATFAIKSWDQKQYRDAIAALSRIQDLGHQPNENAKSLAGKIEAHVRPLATNWDERIRAAKDGSWIDDFLKFREDFGSHPASVEVSKRFAILRNQQNAEAEKLFTEANDAFRSGQSSAGYQKYEEIAQKYYASKRYPAVKRGLQARRN